MNEYERGAWQKWSRDGALPSRGALISASPLAPRTATGGRHLRTQGYPGEAAGAHSPHFLLHPPPQNAHSAQVWLK